MNFKVSLVLIVVLAQIFYTYQTPVQQQRPDDDDDDNEDEYHDNDDKKSVKDNADQIVGAASDLEPPVAEKSANIDETAVNEKPEAEAEPVVNEGVEKSNDEGSEYIEKAQKLLEGNSEVAAEKNSDDEPSLPKTAEVKSPPVEENKEVDTSNKDEDVSSNSKPEVDYQEDSDKVNLKLEPSDPKDEEIKDIKEDFKEEVPEVSELQKPAEVRKEIKEPEIDIEPEPEKKVEEEKEGFLKKPEEIRSGEVKKEDTVVNTASVDKQKVVVNVAPDNGKVEEPSPVKQSETGENKQPPKAGKINTFFIIIPGVVLAFVILIVIAFVIFQRTNKSRTDDETATLPTTTDRKPIYQPVPQNANN